MEVVCGQYARARGLRLAVARVFNLIGPGQSPRFAVPGFARRIAAAERGGDEVELALGNADAVRDFVDVRDGARALLELSRQELQGTYNLCSGQGATICRAGGGARGRGEGRRSQCATTRASSARPTRRRWSATRVACARRPVSPPRSRSRAASAICSIPGAPTPPPERRVAPSRATPRSPERVVKYPPRDGKQRQVRGRGGPPHDRARGRARRRARLHRLGDRDRSVSTTRTTSPPVSRSASASPASRPSPAASTRGCTATGSGRCASTPASPRPRTPTSATAT